MMIKQTRFLLLNSCISVMVWQAILILLMSGAAALLDLSMVWSAEPVTIARVNGEAITQSELERLLADPLIQRQLVQETGVQDPGSKEIERLALRKLIQRRLILKEAERRKLTVTEQELDKAVTALRSRFDDLKDFGAWMIKQGLDDKSLFETIRADILASRAKIALVEGVRATDEEVKDYYAAHKEDLKTEEVWIQIMAVKDRKTAEEVQAALQKGEDFGRLAQQRSIGKRAGQGGNAGWVDSQSLWPPLRDAVSTLKPHEAIGPLQRGDEFLIVRLEERRSGRQKSLDEARTEIERRLLSTKQEEVFQDWIEKQEKKAKIEIVRPDEKAAPAVSQAAAESAAALSRITVSFKLDPRITKSVYMGDRWVSHPAFTAVGNEKECVIEAEAKVFDANGDQTSAHPKWVTQDPEMVVVSPGENHRVTITVRRPGETKIALASDGLSKELFIKAEHVSGVIQVHISQ